jgi:hypothetical protein
MMVGAIVPFPVLVKYKNLKYNKIMWVKRKTMRQIIKNLPGAQMMSDVVWACWLDAVAVAVGVRGRGGVETGIDGAVLRVLMVVVVVVDQQMSINKDVSCIAHESCDVDSTYWCMCK